MWYNAKAILLRGNEKPHIDNPNEFSEYVVMTTEALK